MTNSAEGSRYEDQRPNDGLAVFMPCVHGRRTKGVAAALRRSGKRMFLSGPTSNAKVSAENRYDGARARTSFGENVFVYEEDQIVHEPPDVIVVGREDNEQSLFALWTELSRQKPIVLCSYSGVFQPRFSWERYRGHICCDIPSLMLARYHDVPALKFRPMFAFDDFPYTPFIPHNEGVFAFRSYINRFSSRFPKAVAFHQQCKAILEAAFPGRVLVENIESKSLADVRNLMCDSVATLHIKDQEGLGWSVLESLSTGRPLLVQAGFARNMAFNEWIEPNVTGFLFTNPEELVSAARPLIEDADRRRAIHERSSQYVREAFEGERYADDLGTFLDDLWRLERVRWVAGKPTSGERRAVAPYRPSLDPDFMQDHEALFQLRGDGSTCNDVPQSQPPAPDQVGQKMTSTADDVRQAYRLLLGREAELDAVVQARVGMSLRKLRDELISSREFLRKSRVLIEKLRHA